jgi:major membrane immunogen (membrane-anchored lipoprotein)
MINAYRVKYNPATDTKASGFTVTRIDDGKGYKVSYDYAVNHPMKQAIHEAFGEDTAKIEFIGDLNSSGFEKLYGVHHAL